MEAEALKRRARILRCSYDSFRGKPLLLQQKGTAYFYTSLLLRRLLLLSLSSLRLLFATFRLSFPLWYVRLPQPTRGEWRTLNKASAEPASTFVELSPHRIPPRTAPRGGERIFLNTSPRTSAEMNNGFIKSKSKINNRTPTREQIVRLRCEPLRLLQGRKVFFSPVVLRTAKIAARRAGQLNFVDVEHGQTPINPVVLSLIASPLRR